MCVPWWNCADYVTIAPPERGLGIAIAFPKDVATTAILYLNCAQPCNFIDKPFIDSSANQV